MADQLAQWEPIIQEKAKIYGLSPDLLRAVINQESRGNSKAVSKSGAQGLMQLMPETAKQYGVKDTFDPVQNIDAGARYLKEQISNFGIAKGLAAYNAGPGNVKKYGGIPPFKETKTYVTNIIGNIEGSSKASPVQNFSPDNFKPVSFSELINKPFKDLQLEARTQEAPSTAEGKLSKLYKSLFPTQEDSVLNKQKSVYDKAWDKTVDYIESSPNLRKIGDEMFWNTEQNKPKTFLEARVIPPTVSDWLIKSNSLADLAGYEKGDVQKGIENALSKTISGFSSPEGIGIGAALTTPLAPYVLAAMTPGAVKGTYEAGKAGIQDVKAGNIESGAENLTTAGINALMATMGIKGAYSGIKADIPKLANAYKASDLASERGSFSWKPTDQKTGLPPQENRSRINSQPPTVTPAGEKIRGFTQTVKESQMTPKPLAEGVSGSYTPISNKATLEAAKSAIATDPIQAKNRIFSTKEPTAETNAIGIELIRLNNAKGDFYESIRIANHLAEQATKQGQAIQALSMYDRLGPEGLTQLASKTVKDVRDSLPPEKAKILEKEVSKLKQINPDTPLSTLEEIAAKKLNLPNVSPEFLQKITDRATELQKLPEGRDRALGTAELLRDIGELVPPTLGRKLATYQTIAQLVNPKTAIRNVLGNAIFNLTENVKDLVAAPLDKAVSTFTGSRTKTLEGNQVGAQIKGFTQGLKEGAQEAWRGVDLTNIADKWEINGIRNGLPQGRTFKGKVLGNLERIMGVMLRAPDKAFYKAAFEKSIAEQMALEKASKPTETMIKQAHFDGLYKTFQDESLAAKLSSALKNKVLNAGKEFGVGDFVLKYPKTPGNILSRAIDYSPAGFIKSIMELGKAATGRGFNQRAFVESTSRALVGTAGLTTIGYALSNLGILKNTAARDPDLRGLEKTAGLNQSQLNVSGLLRWITSGFDKNAARLKEGDSLVTYDWAMSLSIPISMGARAQEKAVENANKTKSVLDLASTAAAGLEGGLETLGEQPLIKSFTQLAQGKTLPQSLIEASKGIPASFTPTVLKQFYQLIDNTQRDTRDSNPLKMAANMAIAKTPFAGMLPAKIDSYGKPSEVYQGGTNSVFNVLFNPSFVSKYQTNPETKMVLDLYKNTNDAKVIPLIVDDKFKFNGIPFEMTAKQRNYMQQWVGTRTQKFFSSLANNPEFTSAPDSEKVKVLGNFLTDLRASARAGFFLNEINQKPMQQRPAYMAQLFQQNKLSPDQIKGVFRDITKYQSLNQ